MVGGPFDAEVLTGVNDPPQGGWLWVEQCLEFPNPNIGLPSLLDELWVQSYLDFASFCC